MPSGISATLFYWVLGGFALCGGFLYQDKLSVDVFVEHKESIDKEFSNIKNQLNSMDVRLDKKLDKIIEHIIIDKK